MDGMGDLYFFHFTFWLVFFWRYYTFGASGLELGKEKKPKEAIWRGGVFWCFGLEISSPLNSNGYYHHTHT
jgi:hypothetical protein